MSDETRETCPECGYFGCMCNVHTIDLPPEGVPQETTTMGNSQVEHGAGNHPAVPRSDLPAPIRSLLSELGITADATIASLQRRMHVGAGDAMRLLALHESVAAIEADRSKLRSALIGLVGVSVRAELEELEACMRVMPTPAQDKAVTIDAIHALLDTDQ